MLSYLQTSREILGFGIVRKEESFPAFVAQARYILLYNRYIAKNKTIIKEQLVPARMTVVLLLSSHHQRKVLIIDQYHSAI